MTPRTHPLGVRRCLARIGAFLMLVGPIRVQAAPMLKPPFDGEYTLVALDVPGVPPGHGGLTFVPDDPNTIVIGGSTETVDGHLYAVGVTRDASGAIDGVDGVAVPLADAYGVSAGVAYGPGGVLFYSRSTNEIGEIKPGSTTTDKVVSLARWSSDYPGGLTFVPSGLAGQGKLKFVGFEEGQWWSAGVIPDNKGTFDVFSVTPGPTLGGGPEGFAYVLYWAPSFPYQSILVSEFYSQTVSTYYIDENGDPLVETRRDVISGFDAPDGIATDPVTGDFLITNYYGGLIVMRSAPVPTTSTTSSTTTSSTTSTTRPTTTTTTRPTTTTMSTTSSTTMHPTTTLASSTTSTIATTSSTTSTPPPASSSTSTTTTRTSSSTTTTAVPIALCPDGAFESIACRADGLLTLVRASDDLGSIQQPLVARLESASTAAVDAVGKCAEGLRSGARGALARVDRQMSAVRSRLRTRRARKVVPLDLASEIGGAARAISADVRLLRGSIACQ